MTVYETNNRIPAHIDEDDRRNALNLFQWLAFSVSSRSAHYHWTRVQKCLLLILTRNMDFYLTDVRDFGAHETY
jgi:hypothetical protein